MRSRKSKRQWDVESVTESANALYRFLHRLAEGWECARDSDVELALRLLDTLQEETRGATGTWLPEGTADLLLSARQELELAAGSRSDRRMRHLESADETIRALIQTLPVPA
jgi:hypothetical protein